MLTMGTKNQRGPAVIPLTRELLPAPLDYKGQLCPGIPGRVGTCRNLGGPKTQSRSVGDTFIGFCFSQGVQRLPQQAQGGIE
jgi:hypothetical protein